MKTEEVEQVQTLVREVIKASCDIQKKVGLHFLRNYFWFLHLHYTYVHGHWESYHNGMVVFVRHVQAWSCGCCRTGSGAVFS
jgi:hypothetical protein